MVSLPPKTVSISSFTENAKKILAANDRLRLQKVSWLSIVSSELLIVKNAVEQDVFEDWVVEQFSWTGRYANRILQARSVLDVLVEGKDIAIMPDSISQFCELAKLDSKEMKIQAWKAVVSSGREITAESIKEVVVPLMPPKKAKQPRTDKSEKAGTEIKKTAEKEVLASEQPEVVGSIVISCKDYSAEQIAQISKELDETRRINPPFISQMPKFESDEDTLKRLALKLGKERTSELVMELFGDPTAGTNEDAAESSPPAVADPALETKNFYGLFNADGRAVVYKTIINLWDDDDEVKKSKTPKRTIRPTLEECVAHCKERGGIVDGEAFFAYYESSGWKLTNGNAVSNWKQAVVTWEKHERNRNPEKFASKPAEPVPKKYCPIENGDVPNPNMGMKPELIAKLKKLKPFVPMEG